MRDSRLVLPGREASCHASMIDAGEEDKPAARARDATRRGWAGDFRFTAHQPRIAGMERLLGRSAARARGRHTLAAMVFALQLA